MRASGRVKQVLIRGGLYVNGTLTNHVIVYNNHLNIGARKITKKSTIKSTIVCRLRLVDAQTKHTHHCPQCGDDVDALG